MSSKRGRIKRTKNVRNLDSFDAASLAQSIIEEHSNIIPVGRQLERTPPSKSERVTIHQPSKPNGSPTSGQVVKEELCGQVNKQTNKAIVCLSHTTANVLNNSLFSLRLFLFSIMRMFWLSSSIRLIDQLCHNNPHNEQIANCCFISDLWQSNN